MRVLADGGNAVDAIAAAALVAGVVAVSRCASRYGGHMTIGLPTGKVTCIDFNSKRPRLRARICFRSMQRETSKATSTCTVGCRPECQQHWPAFNWPSDKYGTQPFARLVGPAIRCARDGFPVYWTIDPLHAARSRIGAVIHARR